MGTTVRQQQELADKDMPIIEDNETSPFLEKTAFGRALKKEAMAYKRDPIRGEGNYYPMYYISWNECQDLITQLNQLTGKEFRMPTEAEWEYAARGGSKSMKYKYSGSNNLDDVAWYVDNSGDKLLNGEQGKDSVDEKLNRTHEVKTKQSNELGLYDMSGNVEEWCQDWLKKYHSQPRTNPKGPSVGSQRVFRGGNWHDYAEREGCNVASRSGETSDYRSYTIGLRLAL